MTVPATPTVYIDQNGIHVPSFDDVLTYFQTQYRGIYGADIYIANDAQDGEWLGIIAQAVSDCNSSAVAAYNSRGPDGAQGAGLSSIVKINGIEREVPSASTAEVTLIGQAFVTVTNGFCQDINGFSWALPASVEIPSAGTITVTATCQTLGAIVGGVDAINRIATPQYGWQSVTNATPVTPGSPVETDAQLRIRQAESTAVPGQTIIESLVGQLLNLDGVRGVTPYVNETDILDDNGMPGHCICMVVTGGDDQEIANTIMIGKGTGVSTYGSTTADYTYFWGKIQPVNFQRPVVVPIFVKVNISARRGYSTNIGAAIQAAVVAWINALGVGVDVEVSALTVPAYQNSPTQPTQYKVQDILISRVSSSDVAPEDVDLSFIEQATTVTADVLINVVPG